jgi:hypothetical protein
VIAARAASGIALRWLADENFNNDILRALFRRNPALDIAGLSGADDISAGVGSANSRVLLTHDVSTITAYAYDRVRNGDRMPGVFEVSRDLPILGAVEDLLLITECSDPDEWEEQVRYLPLR